MKEFGLRLKKLRKAKGLNQDELAQEFGVRKTTISNYETGYSTPSAATIRQIADFFNVSVDALLGDSSKLPIMSEPGITVPLKASSVTIPVYSALSTNLLMDSLPLFSFQMPLPFLGDGEFYGLKITGDRMERAALTDGSIAIIRRQDFADDGEIVAIAMGSEPAIVSRFYRSGHYITLVAESSNPLYHPLMINTQEQPVKIFGKVIKVIQPIQ